MKDDVVKLRTDDTSLFYLILNKTKDHLEAGIRHIDENGKLTKCCTSLNLVDLSNTFIHFLYLYAKSIRFINANAKLKDLDVEKLLDEDENKTSVLFFIEFWIQYVTYNMRHYAVVVNDYHESLWEVLEVAVHNRSDIVCETTEQLKIDLKDFIPHFIEHVKLNNTVKTKGSYVDTDDVVFDMSKEIKNNITASGAPFYVITVIHDEYDGRPCIKINNKLMVELDDESVSLKSFIHYYEYENLKTFFIKHLELYFENTNLESELGDFSIYTFKELKDKHYSLFVNFLCKRLFFIDKGDNDYEWLKSSYKEDIFKKIGFEDFDHFHELLHRNVAVLGFTYMIDVIDRISDLIDMNDELTNVSRVLN